ncbi:MAG TPA: NAD(P)H-hydrate dehydratase, partial [Myxococcaceae bacterium]|nr:NAD(P)H-hydrate dehydratase [Myxococcaceae bacterium]
LALGDAETLLRAAEGKSAVVFGPGIPRGDETAALLKRLLEAWTLPTVLDADGLNAVAQDHSLLRAARGPLILTPHPGEMARLLGIKADEVQADRLGAVRKFATAHPAVVVLKGARTLTGLVNGTVYVNPTGNPGMSTAGTGDVLSGLLGALLAQGLGVEDAALVGVYAHGMAGDLAALRTGQMGLTASAVSDALGEVWVRWGR